jgi:hypothetical protein
MVSSLKELIDEPAPGLVDDPEERFISSGVSWEFYEVLLAKLKDKNDVPQRLYHHECHSVQLQQSMFVLPKLAAAIPVQVLHVHDVLHNDHEYYQHL